MTQYSKFKEKCYMIFRSLENASTNLLAQTIGNRFQITLNRPKRYNAFTNDMYLTFMQKIKEANSNQKIKFIVVKGAGGNFTSGNDLSNFTNPKLLELMNEGNMQQIAADLLREYAQSIINSTKPIFGIVQGKTIGVGFTQLALYDKVYAVKGATFNAPLVKIAQGPEMCSAYTFPKIFGKNKGQNLILKGTVVDCEYLQKHGFLQSCKDIKDATNKLNNYLNQLNQLEWNSYIQTRKLFRDVQRPILIQLNKRQCLNLADRWNSPVLIEYIAKHMANIKSKSKL